MKYENVELIAVPELEPTCEFCYLQYLRIEACMSLPNCGRTVVETGERAPVPKIIYIEPHLMPEYIKRRLE